AARPHCANPGLKQAHLEPATPPTTGAGDPRGALTRPSGIERAGHAAQGRSIAVVTADPAADPVPLAAAGRCAGRHAAASGHHAATGACTAPARLWGFHLD